MLKKVLGASIVAIAMSSTPLLAATLSGVFEINVRNFADTTGDSSIVTQTNSAATEANVSAQAIDATVTWTGDIDFRLGSGSSSSTYISDFFASGTGSLSNVSGSEQTFLDNTLLSLGTYKVTTFFEIMGVFTGDVLSGMITHDDGVTLTGVNVTGGVDAPPTTEENTAFTADAGAFSLFYAAANGNPSILEVDVEMAVVPLPAGVVLLLTGLGGLAIARRRKKA